VGLYAAYYAGFRGWTTAIMDTLPEAGGQITAMYPEKDIFDVAGFPSIKGRVLVEALVEQAAPFNPEYLLDHQAMTLETSEEGPVTVTTTGDVSIEAKAVVITGGIGSFTPRALPAGDGWAGRGLVYFVPRLDEHAGKDIVIVGGGDSAFDWAYMLQPIAKSVALVHRRDAFRAHASMVEQVRAMGVTLHTSCEVVALRGDDWLQEMEIKSKTSGESLVLPAQTAVAALGFIANIGPMAEWGLELDHRRIVVGTTMQSNLPRVFGAGDIVTYPGKVPLISVGFGEAALAVNNAAPVIDPDSHVFPGHSSGGSAE
jgi:thioredoxin reductase (NADPH)